MSAFKISGQVLITPVNHGHQVPASPYTLTQSSYLTSPVHVGGIYVSSLLVIFFNIKQNSQITMHLPVHHNILVDKELAAELEEIL